MGSSGRKFLDLLLTCRLKPSNTASHVVEMKELRQGEKTERPWELAIAERGAEERAGFEELASSFEGVTEILEGEEVAAFVHKAARLARRQAMALRLAETRRQAMRRIAQREGLHELRGDKGPGELVRLWRAAKSGGQGWRPDPSPIEAETMALRLGQVSVGSGNEAARYRAAGLTAAIERVQGSTLASGEKGPKIEPVRGGPTWESENDLER